MNLLIQEPHMNSTRTQGVPGMYQVHHQL